MEIKVTMPGCIRFYTVKEKDFVKAGSQIASMEALKMEHKITSLCDCTIEKIIIPEGKRISACTVIMTVK